MAKRIPDRYSLQCDDPIVNGRPCWVQRVRGEKGLFIAAQAKKSDEDGFPYVQTMLVTISADGRLCEYGIEETLGVITTITGAGGRSFRSIEWTDRTGVSWVEANL